MWFNEDQLKTLFSLFDETLSKKLKSIEKKQFRLFIFVIDENNLETTEDEELNDLNKQLWSEEYYPVASRLYQRLIEGNEHFQTIEITNQ